jgi:hypothetical protein
MAKRQNRPAFERTGGSVDVRLPDGRTVSMPTGPAAGSAVSDNCCFCGRELEHTADDRIRLSAQWLDDDVEHSQSWAVHRACLAERMHERVKGVGPFFVT